MPNVTDWIPVSLWVEKPLSAFFMTLEQALFLEEGSLKEMFLHFVNKTTTAGSHTSIFRYSPRNSLLP